jgi:hypothetical protein
MGRAIYQWRALIVGSEQPTYGELCGGPSRLNVCISLPMRAWNAVNSWQIYQAKAPVSSSTSSTSTRSSTTSHPTSQPTIPSVGGYNYVGCFTEATSGRALNLASKTDKAMTLEECASYCSGLNYPIFGAKDSTEVYFLTLFWTL